MAHRLSMGKWWIELDAEATIALAQGIHIKDRHQFFAAYALLHENGSLMHDEKGPILSNSWSDISHHARVNSATWVFSIHDRRIIRVTHTKNGVYADGSYAILVPHKETLESLTIEDNSTHQEIAREEAAKTSKRPSGAENRRRRRG